MNFWEAVVYIVIAFLVWSILDTLIKAIKEVKIKKFDNKVAIACAYDYIKELEKKVQEKESKKKK